VTALPQPAPPHPAPVAPRGGTDRIRGIDAARALAILGMVMVHFGPFEPDTSTLLGKVYRLSHGRASVLFVLLAGVGISLLFAARPRGQGWARIGWRALVFFPIGVALQALPTPVAVILQFYAMYYLVGAAAAMLPTRLLAPLTAVWTVTGPIAFLALADPSLAGRGTATTVSDPGAVVADLLLLGYYPLITWAPPLLVGVLIGRADLRDRATTWALTVAGTAVAAAAYGGSAAAQLVLPPDLAGSSLLLAEGHTGAPLNVLGATGAAVAVLGVCLLVCRALPRATWPVVAVGQMALTVYVGHLLVLAAAPDLLEGRAAVADAAVKVARFYVVTTLLCVGWRAAFRRGPLEWLLALPFALRSASTRRPAGPPGHPRTEDPEWEQPHPPSPPDAWTILDASPDAVAVVDADLVVIAWNAAAEELTGFSAAEAIGGPLPHLTPAQRDELVDALPDFDQWADDVPITFPRHHADGRTIEVCVTRYLRLHDHDGRPAGFASFFRPVRSTDPRTHLRNTYSQRLASSVRVEDVLDALQVIVVELLRGRARLPAAPSRRPVAGMAGLARPPRRRRGAGR
jgi:PAS domain S-box-containing protein